MCTLLLDSKNLEQHSRQLLFLTLTRTFLKAKDVIYAGSIEDAGLPAPILPGNDDVPTLRARR